MKRIGLQRSLVLAVVLIWATTPVVGKLTLQSMSSFELLFYSFPFSVAVLAFALVFRDGIQGFRGFALRDYGIFAFMGFLGCYLYYLLFFAALKIGTAQEVFILNYLWPIMLVVFASIILKEGINIRRILGILLGFAGVATIIFGGNAIHRSPVFNLKADLLVIFAACCYGLFSALGKKLKYDKLVATFHYYLFACIFAILTLPFLTELRKLSMPELFGVIWIGAMTNGIATFLWFKALESGEVVRAASLVFLTPFVSLIYISVFLHEPITVASLVGLVLIVSGAIIADESVKGKSPKANQ